MRRDGSLLDVRTIRLPIQPEDAELRTMYVRHAEGRGLSVVGEVLVEVQPELFSSEIEVTYRARVCLKEN